jgi:Uma2 family endonuclease
MAEAGIFGEDDHVELIEGEVVAMSPIGSRHAACVDKLNTLVRNRLSGERAIVRAQSPIHLGDRSEPQPDLSIIKPRDDYYAAAHPGPESILLLIEVSDASLLYDRTTKLALYARSGIAEVWLVDLVTNVVEVHSTPAAGSYRHTTSHERGSTVLSTACPELRIPASEILIG